VSAPGPSSIFERMSAIARAAAAAGDGDRSATAIVCSRDGRRGRPRRELPPCRCSGCPRRASQAGWGCRPHWFRLPPDLRSRLWRADRDEPGGRAWSLCADEADRWIADHPPDPPRRDRREPELPL